MNHPQIPYAGNHQTTHITYCLTGDGNRIELTQDDAQIIIEGDNDYGPTQVCVNLQDAYALGLWLIGAATGIQTRYPEMVGLDD
jgi:hypothetical protein